MRVGHEVALVLVAWSAVLVGCGGASGSGDDSTAGTSGTATGGQSVGGASAGSGGVGGHAGTSGGAPSQTGGTAGASSAGIGAAGSSGGSVGVSGTGGTGVLSAPFMAIATDFCAAARACCAKEGVDTMLGDCETAFARRQVAFASIDQGNVTVDAAALAKCRAAYEQAASACDENTLIEACRGVFLGTKNVGEPCANSYECNRAQSDMDCLFVDNAAIGVCRKVPHGKSGDACLYSCRTGDNCSTQTNGPADAIITPCYESDGLYCDIFADPGPAICKPILSTGATCTSSDACGTLGVCGATCQPSGVLHGPCGMGCRHDLTCVNDQCEDPSFAVGSICDGYAPAP